MASSQETAVTACNASGSLANADGMIGARRIHLQQHCATDRTLLSLSELPEYGTWLKEGRCWAEEQCKSGCALHVRLLRSKGWCQAASR